jgi:hypothetical protein
MSENTQSQVDDVNAEVVEDEDEDVVEENGEQYVTLYAAANIMNELWERQGSERSVTPQSLYGPARKDRLPGLKSFDDGKKRISLTGVKELFEQANSGARTVGRPDVKSLADQVAAL